ncbi:MAG: hypothetical protein B7Z31_04895 [Rhodobacterales bacterium 12-65-15]|nr:MAG: hypothetical protein B7Z31_04895 [Rhodobacterales bacterium 12-65-15]
MTSKSPPVPPENQSPKGPGGASHVKEKAAKSQQPIDPDKQGQAANTRINTTNQGLQQDR